MFESTIEAQALDSGERRLGPLWAAALAHLGIGLAVVAVAAVIVPKVFVPDPPEHVVWINPTPIPAGERPPAAPPKPPQGGGPSEGPKVIAAAPPEPVAQPVATPERLPEAPEQGPGLDGPIGAAPGSDAGPGTRGVRGGGDGDGDGGPGAGEGEAVELTGDMLRPVLLVKIEPVYPTAARLARLPGKVVVQAVIGPDGSVESAEVQSSTSTLFAAAALDAVRRWRYRPATMNGRPVRVYFKVAVTFTIR